MIDITNSSLRPEEKTAVALGYFDGLHLGHISWNWMLRKHLLLLGTVDLQLV